MAADETTRDTFGLLADPFVSFATFDVRDGSSLAEIPSPTPASARHHPIYTSLSSTLLRYDEQQAFTSRRNAIEDVENQNGLGIADRRPRISGRRRPSNQAFARISSDLNQTARPNISDDDPFVSPAAVTSPYGADDNNAITSPVISSEYSTPSPNTSMSQPFIGSSRVRYLGHGSTPNGHSTSTSGRPIACPSHKHIWIPRGHWLSVTLLILSIFSTVFSGLYFAIALRGPRYTFIHRQGFVSISTVTLLVAFFAKLIELSFVTVFVAFIGQVISRRAFMTKHGRGITLVSLANSILDTSFADSEQAEMSMRNWIVQPGSMLTHSESVRFGVFSLLGMLAMCAAWGALLYTSASAALVSPQLSFGGFEYLMMQGLVQASFANPTYVSSKCETPITTDPIDGADTCMQLEEAAQSYYNYYETYIRKWSAIAKNGNGTSDLKHRLSGAGLLNENITVAGAWIGDQDMAAQSKAAGRLVNNVSMAMPHAGVFTAAMDPINNIMTPEGNEGLGAFSLQASVPSPAVHVICVNISWEELRPLVYSAWPGTHPPFNASDWPNQLAQTSEWRNKTVVDDLFGWNGHGGDYVPPIFPKYPADYNTVLNDTMGVWGEHDAIYLLAKGGPEVGEDYNLCSIRGGLTALCSTLFNATTSGGTMEAVCGDSYDPLRYIVSQPDALIGEATISKDYPNVAQTWARALALSDGIDDAKASNARLLTQLIPQETTLNPGLPSIAEALAVMAGSTLLISTQDSAFLQFWNYTDTILDPGEYQFFNASIQSQQYASGGVFAYQKGFYVVLALIFAFNLLVLGWFVMHKGLVTDFSEPPNLFSLSINSPPSEYFAGSCGGGPDSEQYKVNWFVNVDGEHVYLESKERENNSKTARRPGRAETTSPIVRMYSKLSKRRSVL